MLNIDFVTDFVCPYCVAAKEALEQAILAMKLRKEVSITVHPFELTPEGKEQVDTTKDPVRAAKYREVLEPACEELGLHMHLPPQVSPRPRTRLAWEAWLFAKDKDRGSIWQTCMYHAYFMDQLDIGDSELLKHIGSTIGLKPEEMQAAWDNHTYSAKLDEMEAYAKENFAVRSVPTIYINGKYQKVKEYTKEEMMAILLHHCDKRDEVLLQWITETMGMPVELKKEEDAENDHSYLPSDGAKGGCGPDGCDLPKAEETAGGCGPDGCSLPPMNSCGIDGCN